MGKYVKLHSIWSSVLYPHEISHQSYDKINFLSLSFLPVETEGEGKSQKMGNKEGKNWKKNF